MYINKALQLRDELAPELSDEQAKMIHDKVLAQNPKVSEQAFEQGVRIAASRLRPELQANQANKDKDMKMQALQSLKGGM